MQTPPPPHPPRPSVASSLYKQNSWSPDSQRDEAWLRQKARRNRRSRSVTDEDLDELKACLELGFDFNSPLMDQRLSDTFPAYCLYYAVHNQYHHSTTVPQPSSSTQPENDVNPTIFGPGDNPQAVKTRLKQWAQVVACTVRQSPT